MLIAGTITLSIGRIVAKRTVICSNYSLTGYHGNRWLFFFEFSRSGNEDDVKEILFDINGNEDRITLCLSKGIVFNTRYIGYITKRQLENVQDLNVLLYSNTGVCVRIPISPKIETRLVKPMDIPTPYFTLRKNCDLKFYVDADGDPSAWGDIEKAIYTAKNFIYITGWALDLKQKLQRKLCSSTTLGFLLLLKAQSGVRVLILLWDAPGNIMATYDEEVFEFFKKTPNVRVIMAKRESNIKRLKIGASYFTHHQKIIIVDTPASVCHCSKTTHPHTVSLVAFIGGLDITRGRYDTPDHPLYSTLHTTHREDFLQSSVPGATLMSGAPRLPWHDVHCRISGDAALDVLQNFRDRWAYEVKYKARATGISRKNKYAYLLDELSSSDQKFVGCCNDVVKEMSEWTWNARIVRSIDSSSTIFAANTLNKSSDGRVYENTIQQSYVHAIRGAQNFIYIEQQYFISSSQYWEFQGIECVNIIALEIAHKIVQSILSDKPFHVYIVIPMHPDGDPQSRSVQSILYFQQQTISVICRFVASGILEKETQSGVVQYNIEDSISLFFLGKRESASDAPLVFSASPGSTEHVLQTQRRFMIYVHSKLLIVDDKIIVLGSANINERSMSGLRDTEIGVVAYQVSADDAKLNRHGCVFKFRAALWKEHFAVKFEKHSPERRPGTNKCRDLLRTIARENWLRYSAQVFTTPLQGYALPFPYTYTSQGVRSLPGAVSILDRNVRAYTLGQKPRIFSDFLI